MNSLSFKTLGLEKTKKIMLIFSILYIYKLVCLDIVNLFMKELGDDRTKDKQIFLIAYIKFVYPWILLVYI